MLQQLSEETINNCHLHTSNISPIPTSENVVFLLGGHSCVRCKKRFNYLLHGAATFPGRFGFNPASKSHCSARNTPLKKATRKNHPLCRCCLQLVPRRHLKQPQCGGLVGLSSPGKEGSSILHPFYQEGLRLLSSFQNLQRVTPSCPAAQLPKKLLLRSKLPNDQSGGRGKGGMQGWVLGREGGLLRGRQASPRISEAQGTGTRQAMAFTGTCPTRRG